MKLYRSILLAFNMLLLSSCGSETWFGKDKKLDMPGERIPLVIRSQDIMVKESVDLKNIKLPPINKNSAWNGSYNQFNNKDSNLSWHENTNLRTINYSDSTYLIQPSLPIIDNDLIYLMSNQGVISKYDEHNNKIWENNFFSLNNKNSFFGLGSEKFLSGALYKHADVIYATSGLTEVIAIDSKNGENIWVANFLSPIRSIPLILNNTSSNDNELLIIQSVDNKLYALNSSTGKVVWTFASNSEDLTALNISSPQKWGNYLITKFNNDEIIAVHKDSGQEVWSNNLTTQQELGLIARSNLSNNNTFFIGDNFLITTNSRGNVFKIDLSNGATVWSKDLAATNKGWLVGNSYFFITSTNDLAHLNINNGNIEWLVNINSSKSGDKVITDLYLSNPIMANNNIYVTNNKGELLVISTKNGVIINNLKISKDVFLSPIFSNDHMYIISNSGHLDIF